jgi:hypothetical protein
MNVRELQFVLLQGMLCVVLCVGCGKGKQEIPLESGQTYQLQPSGTMTVYPAGGTESGAQPLKALRVKLKNQGAEAKTPGCWRCSDCICNSDDCSCTECTSC